MVLSLPRRDVDIFCPELMNTIKWGGVAWDVVTLDVIDKINISVVA